MCIKSGSPEGQKAGEQELQRSPQSHLAGQCDHDDQQGQGQTDNQRDVDGHRNSRGVTSELRGQRGCAGAITAGEQRTPVTTCCSRQVTVTTASVSTATERSDSYVATILF